MSSKGWIGVDLDGTLAEYDVWRGPTHIGQPVLLMVERVKRWLAEGKDVRIFTARVYSPPYDLKRHLESSQAREAIERWCLEHIGQKLPVTCTKDYSMILLYDDRAIQVIQNTGVRVDGKE